MNNFSGYLQYKNKVKNHINNFQNKKLIKVHRIFSSTTTLNSSIIKRKRFSSENSLNSYKNNEINGLIYKKSKFVKPKSVYQNLKKKYNIIDEIIIDNNTKSIRNENKPIFFIPPRKNLEANYIVSKTIKTKKIISPICQLYYMNNDYIRNNIFNKENICNNYNESITKMIDTKFKKNNTCFYLKIKNENISNINNINTIKNIDTINTNTMNNKNHPIKIKLMKSLSSTALSLSENNYNLNNNIKNKNLKNNSIDHLTIDYSFRPYIYKKATIKDFDFYSFDDIKMKEKSKQNSIIVNNNIKEKDISIVTFGKPINGNKVKNNANTNNSKYILKLKRENALLKNKLYKTNEKISLLENKIGNLIVEKKINSSHNKTSTKSYTYRKNNRLNMQCLIPTSNQKKYSQRDFIHKKKDIKVSLNSKEKIKPVMDRIFRNNKNKEKNNFKNKDIKDNKHYITSSHKSILKTKILIEKNSNKVYQ